MNLKDPRLRYTAAAVVLVLAGLSAFMVGRYALSQDAPTEAQVNPEQTSADPLETPDLDNLPPAHPDIVARDEAIAEDNAKPLFTGTLNGITFVGQGTPIPEPEDACPRGDARPLGPEELPSAVRGASMDFEVGYLPSGLVLDRELATLCVDEVTHVGRVYLATADQDGRRVAIVRYEGEPYYPAPAPADRMQAATIGGRDAVIVTPIFGNDRTGIIMHDDEGTMWAITVDYIDVDDAIRIAEGIE